MTKNGVLIPPYGGKLVNLVATGAEREALREEANHYPTIQISDRTLHDLELLAIGGVFTNRSFYG
jgi:sulfate adenylyltransferase